MASADKSLQPVVNMEPLRGLSGVSAARWLWAACWNWAIITGAIWVCEV